MLPPIIQRMTDEYQTLSTTRGTDIDIREVVSGLDKQPTLYQARSGVMSTRPFFKFYRAPVIIEEKEITLACSRGTFAAINAMRHATHEKERAFLEACAQIRPRQDCNGVNHLVYHPQYETILTLDQDRLEYRKMSAAREVYVFEFDARGGGVERSDAGVQKRETVRFSTMLEVNRFFDEMHAWVRKFIR